MNLRDILTSLTATQMRKHGTHLYNIIFDGFEHNK